MVSGVETCVHTPNAVYCVLCIVLFVATFANMNEASATESTQQCLFTELQRLKEEAEEKGESTLGSSPSSAAGLNALLMGTATDVLNSY